MILINYSIVNILKKNFELLTIDEFVTDDLLVYVKKLKQCQPDIDEWGTHEEAQHVGGGPLHRQDQHVVRLKRDDQQAHYGYLVFMQKILQKILQCAQEKLCFFQ